jgi:hypothetical protein
LPGWALRPTGPIWVRSTAGAAGWADHGVYVVSVHCTDTPSCVLGVVLYFEGFVALRFSTVLNGT